MIISRGLRFLNVAYRSSQSKIAPTNPHFIRLSHGHGTYRENPKPEKQFILAAEMAGGILWWWVLWHLWHDYGHIIGEFPYPDPAEWTDEELGIPPDDYPEPATHTL